MELTKEQEREIERAVAILESGGIVAFPTETVYGLGADADNEAAVGKVFAAKQRPTWHPLIVHLPDAESISWWADPMPPAAQLLAENSGRALSPWWFPGQNAAAHGSQEVREASASGALPIRLDMPSLRHFPVPAIAESSVPPRTVLEEFLLPRLSTCCMTSVSSRMAKLT